MLTIIGKKIFTLLRCKYLFIETYELPQDKLTFHNMGPCFLFHLCFNIFLYAEIETTDKSLYNTPH